ncbi:MAG: hypothetical protein IKQ05_04415 [Prevotella sp.]|nr:hypothetical protein [Prevotella sp.]
MSSVDEAHHSSRRYWSSTTSSLAALITADAFFIAYWKTYTFGRNSNRQ